MTVVKWLLIGSAGVLLLIVGVSFFLPDSYSVEETVTIEAPASVVYEAVVDLGKWAEWEPWRQSDETMQVGFGELTRGVGASYHWQGEMSGVGRVRITAADPRAVHYEFVFGQNDAYPASSEMRMEPAGPERTEVVWSFQGEIPGWSLNRYVGVLSNLMIERGFEQGLQSLKAFCESADVVEPE